MNIQFKIQLKNISDPKVFRKISVPSTCTFEDFHHVIQVAFGWEDYHYYMFCPKGWGSKPRIGILHEDSDEDDLDASEVKLGEIFTLKGQKFSYVYDFGDDWFHEISVTGFSDLGVDSVILLDGQGKCPPEDCGGPWGYANLIEILNDPKNPEHKEMKEWLEMKPKEKWDVNEYNQIDTQRMLTHIAY